MPLKRTGGGHLDVMGFGFALVHTELERLCSPKNWKREEEDFQIHNVNLQNGKHKAHIVSAKICQTIFFSNCNKNCTL